MSEYENNAEKKQQSVLSNDDLKRLIAENAELKREIAEKEEEIAFLQRCASYMIRRSEIC